MKKRSVKSAIVHLNIVIVVEILITSLLLPRLGPRESKGWFMWVVWVRIHSRSLYIHLTVQRLDVSALIECFTLLRYRLNTALKQFDLCVDVLDTCFFKPVIIGCTVEPFRNGIDRLGKPYSRFYLVLWIFKCPVVCPQLLMNPLVYVLIT